MPQSLGCNFTTPAHLCTFNQPAKLPPLYKSLIRKQTKFFHSALECSFPACTLTEQAHPFSGRSRKDIESISRAQLCRQIRYLEASFTDFVQYQSQKPLRIQQQPTPFLFFSWKLQQISQPQYQKSNTTFRVNFNQCSTELRSVHPLSLIIFNDQVPQPLPPTRLLDSNLLKPPRTLL